jgi:DNA-binding protein HU-beta
MPIPALETAQKRRCDVEFGRSSRDLPARMCLETQPSYKKTTGRTIMNNNDLAEAVAATSGVTKTDARKIVDAVFDAIGDAAAKGEEISLNGFGKFKVKDSPEREGRNPATGEAMTIKASKKLAFAPAKGIKDKLNG